MTLNKINQTEVFKNLQILTISVIVSLVLLFVYSKNSLIYEMNDFSDENNFLSITDAMFHGRVLYRDIFEHKGPFLFLVYALIHILGNSYFTVYLFECITNALFVFFSTKIVLLYDENADKVKIFLYALFIELCLCTSTTFMMGGSVPEELFLWMSSYGLYITLRCLKQEQYYSNRELLFMGAMCGAILWTKYSLLGFYSGLALYIIGWNFAQKTPARFGMTIVRFLIGFAVASIPVLIYCLMTHSFVDMVDIYFVGNIWGKHTPLTYTSHWYHLFLIIYNDIIPALIILTSILWVFKKEQKNIRSLFLCSFVFTFLGSCCLKVFWVYYPMPLLLFVPFGIVALSRIKMRSSSKIIITAFLIVLHLFASVMFGLYNPLRGDNVNPDWLHEHIRVLSKAFFLVVLLYATVSLHRIPKDKINRIIFCSIVLIIYTFIVLIIRDPSYCREQELPKKRFAKTITQVENANILIYGIIDPGFIKTSHTYPQVKYYHTLDLRPDELNSEQLGYIKDELVDFIITPESKSEMSKILSDTSYHLVDTSAPYFSNGSTFTFYLYQKGIT